MEQEIEKQIANKEFYESSSPIVFLNIAKLLGFDFRAVRQMWNDAGDGYEKIPNQFAVIGTDGSYYSTTSLPNTIGTKQWRINELIKNHFHRRSHAPTVAQDCSVQPVGIIDSKFHEGKIGNVALFQHPTSKILCLDIDTHLSTNEIVGSSLKLIIDSIESILNHTGVYPIHSEISKIGRGGHLYYKISEISHVPKVFEIIKRLLEASQSEVKVEQRTIKGKRIRLPMALDRFAYFHETGLRSENLKEIFDSIEEKFNNPENTISYKELVASVFSSKPKLLPQEILDEYNGIS
ncbi:hypothetical protein ACE5IX_19885, partial [Leptospira wolffii]